MNRAEQYCQTIKRMCNSAEPLLPHEYQQVEYLRATGTQYIDTGYIINQPCKIDVTGTIESASQTYIFGINYISGNTTYRVIAIGRQNGYYIVPYWIGSSYNWYNITTADNNRHRFVCDWIHKEYAVDSNTYTITGTFFGGYTAPLYIFARNNYGTNNYMTGQIYQATIYDSQLDKIYDLIPCYRKSDNKPGMYNIVTNTFFSNAGSGEFILGNNV